MKELNKVISELRSGFQSMWRDGYGKEDPMSASEINSMDSFLVEHLEEVLATYIKVEAAKALGISEYLRKDD